GLAGRASYCRHRRRGATMDGQSTFTGGRKELGAAGRFQPLAVVRGFSRGTPAGRERCEIQPRWIELGERERWRHRRYLERGGCSCLEHHQVRPRHTKKHPERCNGRHLRYGVVTRFEVYHVRLNRSPSARVGGCQQVFNRDSRGPRQLRT
ncbi:unnamed protein product, partial [Ectocarpus fasciculatus]